MVWSCIGCEDGIIPVSWPRMRRRPSGVEKSIFPFWFMWRKSPNLKVTAPRVLTSDTNRKSVSRGRQNLIASVKWASFFSRKERRTRKSSRLCARKPKVKFAHCRRKRGRLFVRTSTKSGCRPPICSSLWMGSAPRRWKKTAMLAELTLPKR